MRSRLTQGEAMKGLAHFVSGIAAASFVPGVVQLSAEGGFPLLLAGLGAMLPDVLDFRLARFLQRPHVEVRLDPERPDPQAMAEEIGAAVQRAIDTTVPVILQLPAARTSTGLWRQYTVYWGTEVRVLIGPLVSTSSTPARSTAADEQEGMAPIAQPVELDYGRAVQVDAFGGPTIALRSRGGVVGTTFLHWHRAWSHSLLLAAGLALGVAAVSRPLHGALVGVGATAHILGDQLGHMGSNLFWPLSRRRTRGLGLFHSGEALPNLLTVWLGTLLVVYNLDRCSASPVLRPLALFALAAALPWAILTGVWQWHRRGIRQERTSLAVEQLEEMSVEGDLGSE
jgi:membrane-bound metal-dependent hydrolase YbcI (DUF457 family)